MPKTSVRLPPGCGEGLNEPYLYNPYIHDAEKGFMAARRRRVCLQCKAQGSMDPNSETGVYICSGCQTPHYSNMTAPRAFDRFLVLAGRGGGKTLSGAHAVREEMTIPNGIIWVMGPTYKILHDSTFPTLVRLIDPRWVARWDPENVEIRLVNGTLLAFRSLEDPERARGPHGVTCGWLDEAAQCPERAYDVFEPTLIKAGGIVICTTTVLGFDWTYDKIEKRALTYKEPGYWACRYWTEENPLFKSNPVMMAQIERARRNMAPEFFAQEYQAERRNAQGLIYDYSLIEKQTLLDDEAIKKLVPEWPAISPKRKILVGLDSGADHPFGASKIIVTEAGLVVVGEYLERKKAVSQHLDPIVRDLGLAGHPDVQWAANKNEANLRLEFGLRGVGVAPAENKQEVGIQRVQSWLYSKKLFFAYTVPKTIEQMRALRYADNSKPSGEKKAKEEVFKFKDELPDALRYAIMMYPELPEREASAMSESQQSRWDAFDDKTRQSIERVRDYHKRETESKLSEDDETYPVGELFGSTELEW